MPAALERYRKQLKKYRRDHPNTSIERAREAVSKSFGKSGSVGSKKQKANRSKSSGNKNHKRSVTKTERIVTVGSRKRKTSSSLQRGISISRKIEDMELLLKNTRGVEAKNKIKRMINSEHDKLDALTKNLKSA